MEKDDDLHMEEPLTEEQKFLEEVLQAQEEALRQEREERLTGTKKKKRRPFKTRLIIWLMSIGLLFSSFSIIFQIYSIPAIEFIKISAKLSQNDDIKRYKKSVVEISTGESKGTGFLISSDGLIVTNAHVIENAQKLSVIIPEFGLKSATLIDQFPDIDLAVLQVEGNDYPALTLAEQYDHTTNEQVHFIGNPLYFTNIANEGKIVGTAMYSLSSEVVMLKAPVYKGNSGSPVMNLDGHVIGVIYATTTTEQNGKVGLFIPIDELLNRFPLE
jgi:serine protease Do